MKRKFASAYCDDVLGILDGVEIAKLISTGELKEIEVVEAAIARAQKVNPSINAIATETFELALNQTSDPNDTPFRGVPSFIKDNADVEGVPTLFGSRAIANKPAKKSSKFVKLYSAMGFRCIGKSTLPELALTCTTEPLATGPTRNPWNLDKSTGGSSGGSAALIASGVVPIAHGNDGGGSIRIPAACCGLVGLKPSRGRLPSMEGTDRMPINIVSHGIISRTVRDTAAFYAEAEKLFISPELSKIGYVKHPGKNRLRIAMFSNAPDSISYNSDTVSQTFKVGGVCEELGHEVEEVPFPFQKQVMDDFAIYWALLAFCFHHFGGIVTGSTIDRKKFEKFTLDLSGFFRKNILKIPFVIKRLRNFANQYKAFLGRYDLILSPAISSSAPDLGYLGPEIDFNTAGERISEFAPFTGYQNIAGAPAISLPLGHCKDGLPIGIQFAAALGKERSLIELAFELEEAMPWPRVGEA